MGTKDFVNKNSFLDIFIDLNKKLGEEKKLLEKIIIVASNNADNLESYPNLIKSLNDFISSYDIETFMVYGSTKIPIPEIVLKGLYKNLKRFSQNRITTAKWLRDVLKEWNTIFLENEWSPYYYGRLCIWCGEGRVVSLKYLLPVARTKKSEFWIWDALAEAMDSDEDKIACYCRSITGKAAEEYFKKEIYFNLGQILELKDEYSLASYVYKKCIDLYLGNNKPVPKLLTEIMKSNWYATNAISDKEFREYLSNNVKLADNLLYRDLNIQTGNFIKGDFNQEKNKYYYDVALDLHNIVKLKSKEKIILNSGDPINARIEEDKHRKTIVVWWEKREGAQWDKLPLFNAVVIFKNESFLLAAISKDDNELFPV